MKQDQALRLLLAAFGVFFITVGLYHQVYISVGAGLIMAIGALPWGRWTKRRGK